jgi:hypothetical protein
VFSARCSRFQPLIAICLLLLDSLNLASASLLSDLGSISPEIRAHAAQLIREKHLYRATQRTKWDKIASQLKIGETAPDLSDFLQRQGILKIAPFSFSQNAVYTFRLDDTWMLLCAVNRTEKDKPALLTEYKIVERPKEVYVPPPEGYTGYWRNYRINGEPLQLIYYDQGRSEGALF